jgi:hypothetical protein
MESMSSACTTQPGFEECYPLKRTLLLSMLAVIPAVALSIPVSAQVEPDHKKAAADSADVDYKWEAYGGFAYTSSNQINESRSGLMGFKAGGTRDFGRWFGLTAEGSWYKYPYTSGNPGSPVVVSGLAGPVLRADVIGKYSAFIHALIGVEHSGGESQTPNISFAGGFGGGVEYKLTPRISLRAEGDDIGASFSLINNSKQLGYSPHRSWNPQASLSAVYHF